METDKEIIKFIKQSLEEYEEDYISGAWENFVNKQKKRKKIIVLWKLSTGIAASLFLCWLTFHPYHLTNKNELVIREGQIIENEKNNNSSNSNKNFINDSLELMFEVPETGKKNRLSGLKSFAENNSPEVISPAKNNSKSNKTSAVLHVYNTHELSGSFSRFPNKIKETLKTAIEPQKRGDSINNIFISEPEFFYIESEKNKKERVNKRKIRFGINVSSGINSSQTAGAFCLSGGITTNLPLYKNLELSTGLLLEHQRVVTNGQTNNSSIPSDRFRADLLNFDLPINITWKFFTNKSKSYYISGGLSSLACLNEKYENISYTQELMETLIFVSGQETVSYKLVNIESKTQNSVSTFQSFDIAGRVNIIIGFEQNLSEKIFLHFEPYLKIPISTISTENLRFTTSGITCKLSF